MNSNCFGYSISLYLNNAEEENRWVARHHPFTSPKPDHIDLMVNNDPGIENAANYLEASLRMY